MVSKVFEKLVNNSIFDHLEECDLFSELRELQLLIYPRLSRKLACWSFHKRKSYRISGQIFGLISSFLNNRKSSQDYPVNTGVLKAPFVVLRFSHYTLRTFLLILSVMLLSMVMILLSNLNVIRHLICGSN